MSGDSTIYASTTARTPLAEPSSLGAFGMIESRGLSRITWDRTRIEKLELGWSTVDVLYNLQKTMPVAVWETSVLEGIVITLPEVQTLMEGTSVDGRPLHDLRQVDNIATAYRHLHELVEQGTFELTSGAAHRFNFILERDEILDPGKFRLDHTIVQSPGGEVALLDGTFFRAPDPGAHGESLHRIWQDGISAIETIADPDERGLATFAWIAYNQFYYNGNKRTAKFLANGVLMSHGINAVNPSSRTRDTYNAALDHLYRTSDATAIMQYLSSESRRYRPTDPSARPTLAP